MLRKIKYIIKLMIARFLVRVFPPGVFRDSRFFYIWQSHEYHIMPVHFYNPIPDTRRLKEDIWTRRSELVGVDMNESKQLEILSEFGARYKPEYELLHSRGAAAPDWGVLYCMIRHFKPRRIIEIGSGASTAVSAMAIERNKKEQGVEARLIAIEPHPSQELIDGLPGLSELKSMPVQDVPLAEFQLLCENDILFIDSSHMLKIGSDVQYEYLEIIPRLKNGVIVHIHDIFFPYEYPREWVMEKSIFWNEAYMLQAFLAFNSAFEVIWSSSYLHHHHPGALQRAFSRYHPQDGVPSSFYMRRIDNKHGICGP